MGLAVGSTNGRTIRAQSIGSDKAFIYRRKINRVGIHAAKIIESVSRQLAKGGNNSSRRVVKLSLAVCNAFIFFCVNLCNLEFRIKRIWSFASSVSSIIFTYVSRFLRNLLSIFR